MKNLASFYASFKFNDPRVFAVVTLIANILVFTLDYFGTYGAEANKPMILAITSIVTYVLTNLGVRTSRYINPPVTIEEPLNTESNDSNTN